MGPHNALCVGSRAQMQGHDIGIMICAAVGGMVNSLRERIMSIAPCETASCAQDAV
jgi:hypothetical protein